MLFLCVLAAVLLGGCNINDDDEKYDQLVMNNSSFTLYSNGVEIPSGKNADVPVKTNLAGRAIPLTFSDCYGDYPRINISTKWIAIPVKEHYTVTDSSSCECYIKNVSSEKVYVYNNYFGSTYSEENRCVSLVAGKTSTVRLYNDNLVFSCMYENDTEAHYSIIKTENGYKISVY